MKFVAYWLVLRPLIRRDYRLRAAGRRPDRMHWADALACGWGWFTDAARSDRASFLAVVRATRWTPELQAEADRLVERTRAAKVAPFLGRYRVDNEASTKGDLTPRTKRAQSRKPETAPADLLR